ncbi:MAG TPA: hypothetical protein VL727_03780 [Puia sp.]|nr:hypothetical protein [Puia sp.]
MTLLTKIQQKNYEAGEFSDLKERTYSETIGLIQNFPWLQQREHISIGLTNPSITIEGSSGDYLKLAPYFNGKFVLYYVDTQNHLYTHSMATISEAEPLIQSFFEGRLNPTDLKREPTPFVDNRAQFQTRAFTYTMHATPTILWVSFLSLLWLVFPLAGGIGALLSAPSPKMAVVLVLGMFIVVLITVAVLQLASTISHYRASKGKFLSISRGNPLFRFGNINAPATYDKKDIREIIQYSAYKGLEGLQRTQIIFNDNSEINISGMIASTSTMSNKFPQVTIKQKTKAYPILPVDG